MQRMAFLITSTARLASPYARSVGSPHPFACSGSPFIRATSRRVRPRAPLPPPHRGYASPRAATASPASAAAESSMFEPEETFARLGACESTVAALQTQGITVPTRVQAAVMPVLLAGFRRQLEYGAAIRRAEEAFELAEAAALAEVRPDGDSQPSQLPEYERPPPPESDPDDVIMLGAETGSGKTLAYLMPYIEAVRLYPDSPAKAIIMVPSRELCAQVARQLTTYFPDAPPHLVLAGGSPPDVSDVKSVRIVIATPAALLNYFRFSAKIDANDKYIVVDEADMLLTGSFCREVEEVLDQPGMKPFALRKNKALRAVNRNRLLFVGATYPHWTGERVKSIVTWMRKRYPNISTVQTSAIHKRSSSITEEWHLLESDEDKMKQLLAVLGDECSKDDKVMIFCNQASGCEDLFVRLCGESNEDVLAQFGSAQRLHKHVPAVERELALSHFRAGESRLLVCTDLAARGLDLGNVTRVIEYEFSTNVVGYLHRIGRTARAGSKGKTDHFYSSSNNPLADAIRTRSQENVNVVDGVFSRDRSFRRKYRKLLSEEAENSQ